MKPLAYFVLLSFTLSYCSCTGQQLPSVSSECIAINNKGTESLLKYQAGQKAELLKAIIFYKDAIKCEPKYILAYTSLALAYDYKKDYKEELNTYNKLQLFCGDDPVILTEKGVVFEKLKQVDSAKILYQVASQKFKKKLTIQPNNTNALSGLLLILALNEGKESALRELDKRIVLNPEIASKMASEYYFYKNFDKSAYIYHLSQ